MTRGFELLLQRALRVFAFCCFMGAVVLLAELFYLQPSIEAVDTTLPVVDTVQRQVTQTLDPKIAKLAETKMTRTAAPKAEPPPKPVVQAPNLATLIKLKGIMDFGDPKKNEALIESLRSQTTKSYRAGDALQDVNAIVTKVDTGVTVDYDGKSVRLNVDNGENADLPPTAGKPGPALSTKEYRSSVNP